MHGPYSISPAELMLETGRPVFEQGMPITDADLNLLGHDLRVDLLLRNFAGTQRRFEEDQELYLADGHIVRLHKADRQEGRFALRDVVIPSYCFPRNRVGSSVVGRRLWLCNKVSEVTPSDNGTLKVEGEPNTPNGRYRIEVNGNGGIKWCHGWDPATLPLQFRADAATPIPGLAADLSFVRKGMLLEILDPVLGGRIDSLEAPVELVRIERTEANKLILDNAPASLSVRDNKQFRIPWCRVWTSDNLKHIDGGSLQLEVENPHRGDYWLVDVADGNVRVWKNGLSEATPHSRSGGWRIVKALRPLNDLSSTEPAEGGGGQEGGEGEPPVEDVPVSPDSEESSEESSDSAYATPRSDELLSDAGISALRQYLDTPREVLRRIPARYLKTAVTYPPLTGWLAPALLSEIVNMTFDEFAEEFQQVFTVPADDWPLFEQEARNVLDKAQQFSRMMASNAGVQNVLS